MTGKPKTIALSIMAIVCGVMLFSGIVSLVTAIRTAEEHSQSIVMANKTIEQKLAAWIYFHSEQISVDTAREISRHCMKTKYPLLMIALISVESEFKQTAVSKAGAMGLTQVMFKQHKDMLIKAGVIKDRRDLFNISNSVRAGDAILAMYLDASHGNIEKALERYLGGRDGAYVKRILLNMASMYMEVQ